MHIGYCLPSDFQLQVVRDYFKVEIDKNMYPYEIIYATGTLHKFGFNQHRKRIPFRDVKNEVVQIFSDRRAHMEKRNRKVQEFN